MAKKHHPHPDVKTPPADPMTAKQPQRHTPRGPGEEWTFSEQMSDIFSSQENRILVDKIKDGRLAKFGEGPSALPTDKTVINDITHIAHNLKLPKDPVIYVDVRDASAMPFAGAAEIVGKEAIIVNDAALSRWMPKQLEGVLSHEVVHLVKKDDSTKAVVSDFLTGTSNKVREMNADKIGTGPLGTCDPRSLSEALQVAVNINFEEYQKYHHGETKGAFMEKLGKQDEDHPLALDRIKYLNEEAEHPTAPCATPSFKPAEPVQKKGAAKAK
jgi:Zn-dependent protease with chaperone function